MTAEEIAGILSRLEFACTLAEVDGETVVKAATPDHRLDIGSNVIGVADLMEVTVTVGWLVMVTAEHGERVASTLNCVVAVRLPVGRLIVEPLPVTGLPTAAPASGRRSANRQSTPAVLMTLPAKLPSLRWERTSLRRVARDDVIIAFA
jgi:hypothetical protein